MELIGLKRFLFVSQECYRRDWELGGTTLGWSAGANPPRLACIGVAIVRDTVARARGFTGRGEGRMCSIVGLVHCDRLTRGSCASGVLSELEGRGVTGVVGRAVLVVNLSIVE